MTLLKRYFLTDGQFLVTAAPADIHTVLGSCVAVCLWDKELKIGGMNHYLLPGSEESSAGNPNHGYSSIRMMLRTMINRGARMENVEAKVFGGCNSWTNCQDLFTVGSKNIEVANFILKEEGIRLTVQQTGGCYGRKIVFNTSTGKVKMHMLTKPVAEANEYINKGFDH